MTRTTNPTRSDPESDRQRAQAIFQRGLSLPPQEIQAKIAAYSEAIALDPTFAEAYARRGGAYSASGDLESAVRDCTEAIRLNPALYEAYFNRARARVRMEDYPQAIADYGEAIRLRPDDARLHLNRGAAHNRAGDLENAIADYSEAIRIDPSLAEAYFNRSVAHSNLNHFEEAIQDFSQHMHLTLEGGKCNRPAEGNTAETVAYLERLLRHWPDHPQAAMLRGEIERLSKLVR